MAGQGLAQNVLELIAQLLDLSLLALLLGQQLLQVVVGFLFSVGVLTVQVVVVSANGLILFKCLSCHVMVVKTSHIPLDDKMGSICTSSCNRWTYRFQFFNPSCLSGCVKLVNPKLLHLYELIAQLADKDQGTVEQLARDYQEGKEVIVQ